MIRSGISGTRLRGMRFRAVATWESSGTTVNAGLSRLSSFANLSKASAAMRRAPPSKPPQPGKLRKYKLVCRWQPRRRSPNMPAAKASVSRAGTRRPHGYRAPQESVDVSRKATPHFTAGLGDALLSDLDVEIFPKSAQAATGVFRPVLLFQ